MAIYRLQRQSDLTEYEADAQDSEQAVSEFGQMLGLVLTLDERSGGPQYMMKCKSKDVGWDKPPTIPVWEA